MKYFLFCLCLLFAVPLSAQDTSGDAGTVWTDLDNLEVSLLSLEQTLIDSRSKMQSLQTLIDEMGKDSGRQAELLAMQAEALKEESERSGMLLLLSDQLKKDLQKSRQWSTIKNYTIAGLGFAALTGFVLYFTKN